MDSPTMANPTYIHNLFVAFLQLAQSSYTSHKQMTFQCNQANVQMENDDEIKQYFNGKNEIVKFILIKKILLSNHRRRNKYL